MKLRVVPCGCAELTLSLPCFYFAELAARPAVPGFDAVLGDRPFGAALDWVVFGCVLLQCWNHIIDMPSKMD